MTAFTESGLQNLSDLATRLDPNGMEAKICNVLSQENDFLGMIPWKEGNLPTGHQLTYTDTALPSGTWREMNDGVAPTKGKTIKYTESCGLLEDESIIDEAEAELNGGAAWRASEASLKTEGISQQFAEAFFYESVVTHPERVHGLAARYPATSGYVTSPYVDISDTNSGDDSFSVWLLKFGDRQVYGIYPKGTKAGIEFEDTGKQRVAGQTAGTTFMAWTSRIKWRCGIVVEDYRYAVRIQYDPDSAEFQASEKGLYLAMLWAQRTIQKRDGAVFLMNRDSRGLLDQQLASNDARYLSTLMEHGKLVENFNGNRIFTTDALVEETSIS